MKKLTLFLLILSLGCSGDESDESDVRFFNAIGGAQVVSVRIDGNTLTSELPYGEESRDFSIERGSRRVRVDTPGIVAPIIDERLSILRDYRYRIYLIGSSVNDAATVLVRDSLRESIFSLEESRRIDDGEFRLRFSHLSPRGQRYDIYLTEPEGSLENVEPILSSVAFRQTSRHFDLPQGAFRVIVTETRTRNIVLDSGILSVNRRNSFSFLIFDQLSGGEPLQSTLVLED